MPTSRLARALPLALALVGLLLAGGSLLHVHIGAEPGVWNHDHDASLLAAFG
ncbi:MAG: hypothetical protein HY729_11190, partial [Candidatus Rokubacteria bacterium]|nr:hypothetical protein [Candidatus Rokubacteria bacterium]